MTKPMLGQYQPRRAYACTWQQTPPRSILRSDREKIGSPSKKQILRKKSGVNLRRVHAEVARLGQLRGEYEQAASSPFALSRFAKTTCRSPANRAGL